MRITNFEELVTAVKALEIPVENAGGVLFSNTYDFEIDETRYTLREEGGEYAIFINWVEDNDEEASIQITPASESPQKIFGVVSALKNC